MLFAYIGPETMMPVASIIAAAAGVALMFGRSVMSFGRNLFRRIWPGARRKHASSVSRSVTLAVSLSSHTHQAASDDRQTPGELPPGKPGESPEV